MEHAEWLELAHASFVSNRIHSRIINRQRVLRTRVGRQCPRVSNISHSRLLVQRRWPCQEEAIDIERRRHSEDDAQGPKTSELCWISDVRPPWVWERLWRIIRFTMAS